MRYKIFHKTKAFTLSEMLVVMVSSLIIIALCFTVIRLIDNYFVTFKNQIEHQTQHYLIEQQLWSDFNHYEVLELKAHRNLIFSDYNDTVRYQFFSDKIVRQKDTFLIAIQQIEFFIQAQSIEQGRVDAVQWVTGESQPLRAFVFRDPSVFDFNPKFLYHGIGSE